MDIRTNRLKSVALVAGGGLIWACLIAAVCFLVVHFVPWRILAPVLCGIVLLLLLAIVAGAFIPLDLDGIMENELGYSLDASDEHLLKMALQENPGQGELDSFLEGWDIEKAPIKSVMLVAYLMKIHPELKFPAAMIPRLNGVLTFCRFQNLKKEAHLCRLGKLFAARDIPFVVMKGGAMKVYRPDFPRWMADIDIMVPEDKYASAVDIATSSGYSSAMFTSHSVDVSLPDSEESLLDIHCHLEMMTGKEAAFNEGLFSRASEVNVFSVRGLLPCPEDMVFISLVNLFKNISKKSSEESCLTSFYDLQYLVGLKKDFDWELILENARLTASEFQTYVSSLHISRVLPGLLPDSFMNPGSLGKKRIERGAVDFIFRRNITSGARDQVMGTEAGKSLQKDWNLKVSMWVSLVGFVKLLFSMYWLRLLILKYRYLFLGKNKPYTK